jgi:hypothetical protein
MAQSPALLIFNPAYASPGFCESQGFPDPALVTLGGPEPRGLALGARDACEADGRASRWTIALGDDLPPVSCSRNTADPFAQG